MPKVKKGESRSDYMARCVPVVKGEGLDDKAAVGKCEGMFDQHKIEERAGCAEYEEEK